MLPFISIFGKQIPAYGLCMAIGILVCSFGACLRAHRNKLCVEDLIVYGACIIGVALFGAAILYNFVTYGFIGLIKEIQNHGIDEIIKNNGLVFYGGLLGGLVGMLLAYKITRTSPKLYYVSAVPFIPIGHAFGRLGCFCAGCCYGKESNSIFAMKFKAAVTGVSPDIAVLPTQLFEVIGNVFIAIYLLKKYPYNSEKTSNVLFEYLILYAVMRFFIEFCRGDALRGSWMLFSTSQWISISMILVVSFLLYRSKKKGMSEQYGK